MISNYSTWKLKMNICILVRLGLEMSLHSQFFKEQQKKKNADRKQTLAQVQKDHNIIRHVKNNNFSIDGSLKV